MGSNYTFELSSRVNKRPVTQRGFIVLAFDPAYMGESGGEPRHVSYV